MSDFKLCLQVATNHGDGDGPVETHKTRPGAAGAPGRAQQKPCATARITTQPYPNG